MASDSSKLGQNRFNRSIVNVSIIGLCLTCCLPMLGDCQAQNVFDQFDDYDLMMFDRPKVVWVTPSAATFPDGLVELWGRALVRPEPELQRLVIDTLPAASQLGVEGVRELTPTLIELSRAPDQSLDVLRSICQTLIAFDGQNHDELLAELALRHGEKIAQLVEPAIANWKSTALEQAWLDRINGPFPGTTMSILALNGLGAIGSERADPALRKIVRNLGEQNQVRLAAARALGEIHQEGLVELADELVAVQTKPSSLHPLLAIKLLARHDDAATSEFLTKLVDHENTAVQSEALEQLYRIDFNLVDQHREKLVDSPDVNVRRWCFLSMADKQQADRLQLLCRLLDDVNPTLRRDVAAALVKLADEADLREEVIAETTKVFEKNDWRGCEQACVVLTRLDHKPSGERMVELLGHERGEVQVASAWGLSKLRLPELLPDMLDHASSVYEGFRSGQLSDDRPGTSLHVAHLFLAFGDQLYSPAEELMRKYLPKNHLLGFEVRAAAAWSIGMLHEGDPDPELVKIFVGRVRDAGMNPDTDILRDMSAISLGRMNAEAALATLREFAGPGMPSCYWAIEQITGEKPPEPKVDITLMDDWFLSPLPK